MSYFTAYTDYLALEKGYSNHTVRAYIKDLDSFLCFCNSEFGMTDIHDCLYSHIRMWIVSLLESGCSNRTVNRKIASLKSYYKYLSVIGDIKASPLLKHNSLKVSSKIQIPFSLIEVENALAESNFDNTFEGIRDSLIIEMFYATGMRKSELIGVTLPDLDMSLKTIRIVGKGNKERFIPLTDVLIFKIERYLLVRSVSFEFIESNYFFLTKRGGKLYNSLVYRIINLYFGNVSTKLKKSPHVLRHTFATHLIDKGADLNSVKELLGHASIAATQIYVHNSMAKLKDVYGGAHPRNLKK